jgi:uncharacterized repeat protein (TIGR03803 family)
MSCINISSVKFLLMSAAAMAVLASNAPGAVAGGWSESILYSFQGFPKDGDYPLQYGNLSNYVLNNFLLYGTTSFGGKSDYGTVFTMDMSGKGADQILYSFAGATDGQFPMGTLWFRNNNTYDIIGTTQEGGAYNQGAVFELTSKNGSTYKKKLVYSFGTNGGSNDGSNPDSGIIMDTNGNMYGTTAGGGPYSAGTIFKISPQGTETVLHAMNGADEGYLLEAGLVMDGKGNLYGVAQGAGNTQACNEGCGTIFKVSPSGKLTVLHAFTGNNGQGQVDGRAPFGGLVMDGTGALFGTTSAGGTYDLGTAFEITAAGKYKVLYADFSFTTGASPGATLALDNHVGGYIYGTTSSGGYNGNGVVFALTLAGKYTDIHDFGMVGDAYNPTGGLLYTTTDQLFGAAPGGSSVKCGNECGAIFVINIKR